MEIPRLSELAKIRDYETLVDEIIKFASIQHPKSCPEDLVDKLKDFQTRLKENPNNLKTIFQYSAFLYDIEQDECFLANCARALKINKNSAVVHSMLGTAFERRDLFHSAYALFSKGLELKGEGENDDMHRTFHEDLSRLIFEIHQRKPGIPLEEFGFLTQGFRFDEKGFYLPDFDYNFRNVDYKTYGMQIGKERTLASIHSLLERVEEINGLPHIAENCPIFC